MTEIRWTEQATEDLAGIKAFISHDSPAYALAVVGRLYHSVGQLTQFPDSGRVVPKYGRQEIRELVRPPYRIVYRRRPELVSRSFWYSDHPCRYPRSRDDGAA